MKKNKASVYKLFWGIGSTHGEMQTNEVRGGSVGPLEVCPHGNLRSGEDVFPQDTYLVPHSVSGFRDITVGVPAVMEIPVKCMCFVVGGIQ